MIIEFYFILIIATFCRVGLTTAADLDPELRVVEGAAGRDEGMALTGNGISSDSHKTTSRITLRGSASSMKLSLQVLVIDIESPVSALAAGDAFRCSQM
jgi:hypothetical protein